MLPIIHTINRGGSPHGLSKTLRKLDCPLKYTLDEQAKLKESLVPTVIPDSPLLTGIIGHAYLEAYFKLGATSFGAVQFDEVPDERSRQLAERAVSAFIAGCPSLGTPVGVEADLSGVVGGGPRTGRADLVTEITADEIYTLRQNEELTGQVGALRPGYILWDYKFRGRRDSNLIDRALVSWQYVLYSLLSEWPLQACVNITILTLKEIKWFFTVVPPPTAERVKALEAVLRQCDSIDPNLAVPSESNCFGWGRVCPHLGYGCTAHGIQHK